MLKALGSFRMLDRSYRLLRDDLEELELLSDPLLALKCKEFTLSLFRFAYTPLSCFVLGENVPYDTALVSC